MFLCIPIIPEIEYLVGIDEPENQMASKYVYNNYEDWLDGEFDFH